MLKVTVSKDTMKRQSVVILNSLSVHVEHFRPTIYEIWNVLNHQYPNQVPRASAERARCFDRAKNGQKFCSVKPHGNACYAGWSPARPFACCQTLPVELRPQKRWLGSNVLTNRFYVLDLARRLCHPDTNRFRPLDKICQYTLSKPRRGFSSLIAAILPRLVKKGWVTPYVYGTSSSGSQYALVGGYCIFFLST